MWVARRARGLRSGLRSDPRADGLPTCDFLNCKYGFGNIMLLSKNACYSAKSMLLSQKQRRYTYDSIVYAPTLTLLTILFILQVLIKAHLSFEHLILFNGLHLVDPFFLSKILAEIDTHPLVIALITRCTRSTKQA